MRISIFPLGFLAASFLLLSTSLSAQRFESKPQMDQSQKITTLTVQASGTAVPVHTGKITETNTENWGITITNYGQMVDHESEISKSELASLKEPINQAKLANPIQPSIEKNTNNAPVAVGRYFGGPLQTGFPPDNHVAISDGGKVVSVVNSVTRYYDEDGNATGNATFTDLFSELNLVNFMFDPKVLYDPVADRFIMVVLAGSNSSTSNVILAFSETNDPTDGWHAYSVPGNPLNNNTWFDFPSIGISDQDLFVSGNLFTNGSGFDQVVIFQVDKDAGFAGEPIEWEVFGTDDDNIFSNAFTVKPVSYGFDGSYGPGGYMISTSSFGGGTAYLYDVTDSVQANQEIDVYSISIPNFNVPGDGQQMGSSNLVGTGDARVQTGFFANGILHFAHTVNSTANYAGIRYYRVNVGSLTATNTTVNQVGSDFGFPAIAPFSMDVSDPTIAMALLRTNSNIFPEVRAMTIDENMGESDPILVKLGESPITALDQAVERWGDYSGISRRHNAAEPTVWIFGCYGRSNTFGNWISELVPGDANAIAPVANFEADFTEGIAPLTVNFTDLSENNPYFWEWDIEGTSNKYDQNPSHTFSSPGLYNVELTVINEAGQAIENKVDYINVLPAGTPPTANFTSDVTTGPAPLTVNFEDTSIENPTTWQWILSGGNPAVSTDQNPMVVYNSPGTYKVRLVVNNSFGNDIEEKVDYIIVTDPSSTSEVGGLSTSKVYPNPAAERVTVEFYLEKTQLLDLQLVDQQGRLVKVIARDRVKGGQNALSFNVQTLAAGTYYLVIADANGQVLKTESIQVN